MSDYDKFLMEISQKYINDDPSIEEIESANKSKREELIELLNEFIDCPSIVPIESLAAVRLRMVSGEVLEFICVDGESLNLMSIAKESQKVILCQKLSVGELNARDVEILWKILFGENIGCDKVNADEFLAK